VSTTLTEADALDMPEIGVSVPLAEIYAGVEFPEISESGLRP
jgi:hypothetical protein